MWILIESESDIEIFQMYGIDGAGPAPSLSRAIPIYQVLPCLVIHVQVLYTARMHTHTQSGDLFC